MTVSSAVQLAAADPIAPTGQTASDVEIEFAEDVGSPKSPHFVDPVLEAGAKDLVFRPLPGLAFRIRDGAHITIARAPIVSDIDINLYLVGSVWGVLCHQRGWLPLHCSAVQSGGMAAAFTGPSGAGKSTLAAGLAKRGFKHLCDDVCVIRPEDEGRRLYPMPKGLKLWRDAIEALGLQRGGRVSTSIDMEKYHVAPPNGAQEPWLDLAALYMLAETDDESFSVTGQRGGAHFERLFNSIYRIEWLPVIRDSSEVFLQISKLARRLPVYEFARPRNIALFGRGLDVLQSHIQQLTSEQEALHDH